MDPLDKVKLRLSYQLWLGEYISRENRERIHRYIDALLDMNCTAYEADLIITEDKNMILEERKQLWIV